MDGVQGMSVVLETLLDVFRSHNHSVCKECVIEVDGAVRCLGGCDDIEVLNRLTTLVLKYPHQPSRRYFIDAVTIYKNKGKLFLVKVIGTPNSFSDEDVCYDFLSTLRGVELRKVSILVALRGRPKSSYIDCGLYELTCSSWRTKSSKKLRSLLDLDVYRCDISRSRAREGGNAVFG